MGRFFGKVGYALTVERMTEDDPPLHTGIFEDSIIEREYYGDAKSLRSSWNNSGYVNNDLSISTEISIIADAFAYENFSRIKYVEFMGIKWGVRSITPQRPRLILTLGGEYNGPET